MSDFYSERQVAKTRKDHRCLGCWETIPAGESASNIAGSNDDGFHFYYLCAPCRDYLDSLDWQDGDFWSEGDLGNVRRQEEREKA